MPTPPVILFADACEHLASFQGGTAAGAEAEIIRAAVIDANRELGEAMQWRHLERRGQIVFDAPYATGTITYTHSSRTVTLAGGTWPTWAKYGRIKIGTLICDVASRTSDAVIVLDEYQNPGQDVAALTAYSLRRNEYPLPGDLKRIANLEDENRYWTLTYSNEEALMRLERTLDDRSDTFRWTILSDPDRDGGWVVRLYGYPTTVRTMRFVYEAYPRELKYSGFETAASSGRVSNTAAAVTASASVVPSDVAGSYLRFGTTSDYPTGMRGSAPFAAQGKIESWTNSGAFTLAADPGTNYASVYYRISDPIELPTGLFEAFWRLCEWKLELMRRNSGGKDGTAYSAYIGAYRRACANDLLYSVPTENQWDNVFTGLYPGQPIPY